ncbi:Ribosomal protein S7 [Paramicrosporidium saccamoebae]|uniref:Ribosomal protein S7 n=1 Tax=Paramicrosporidium saccamoebae TaxID=1246581 RepID=A0A2H9TP27_9FUNG|nr:Ribosomal protein S7 [Paramicrosporidium saccamoebae]
MTPAANHRPTTPHALLRHLSALLTKAGQRGEPLVSSVNAQLRLRYGVDNPIQIAVDAIKPVIKYYKSKITRRFVPLALYPRNAEAMAMRWVIEQANGKSYIGGRPDIVRALVDEFDSIIQGTSTLYIKRFNTHRNPN